ncbi:MAG: N-acetyl-gamma-glutamyl-phosphate reductase [Thermodesulfovibrionales bacterium]|nr:N-acetyl-gamma-glutamyl-phosphate reductase [Thermodesulfovibrionales bacterium]
MINIAICGASGYTGAELLRILSQHPNVKITSITSEQSAGKRVVDLYPHLVTLKDLVFEPLDKETIINKADLFFLALPHGASQDAVNYFYKKGKKVIDLSADYRLRDIEIYQQWYKIPHKYPDTLIEAVYGLPELYREQISKADLIANPGCYPTTAILGLMPALRHNLIDIDSIVIDSKSGVTGAGRKAEISLSFSETNEGFRAYGIATHRHRPEIEQELSQISKSQIKISFTPHLLPLDRGILSTIYCKMRQDIDTKEVLSFYKETYEHEPFVIVMDEGLLPDLKDVRGSNYCMISVVIDKRINYLVIVSVIDNLVKGASGQAVQNMNIMMGFDETTGLNQLGLFP